MAKSTDTTVDDSQNLTGGIPTAAVSGYSSTIRSVSPSQSPSISTELQGSSTSVHSDISTEFVTDRSKLTSNISHAATAISNSFSPTSEASKASSSLVSEDTRDTENWTLSAQTTLGYPMNSPEATTSAQSHSAAVAVVLPILFLLILAVVAILLYIRYRKKIRLCKPKTQHKETNGADNGFASHHVTNEMELKKEKRAYPMCQSTGAPPTIDDLIELRTNSDEPNVALSSVKQSKRASPTLSDSSKPPPIADRSTETPPSTRQKRKTKTTSCQLAYVPPPANEDFMDCIKRHQENLILYQKEFDCLPDGSIKSSSVARVQQNIVKNRYVNVLPYDYNRVVLPKKSEDDSDFTNASFIDGAVKKNAYISSQGPLSSTLGDFWSMIWSNDCHRILMLTNLEESIRGVKSVKTSKCAQYWPSKIGHSDTHGDIEVTLLKESVELDWTVRTLAVKKEGCDAVRTVVQYHYTTWPDQDVPHTSTAILKFHRLALQSSNTDESLGPIVVHCSAGVGRTGTLIAIDILAETWKETQPRCDVFKCVQSLRQQRMSMVQSVRQYMFIHHSLIQEFRIGLSVEQTPQEMLDHRLTTQELQEQFKILEATSVTSIPLCSVSKSKPKKNRSSTILPTNGLIRFLKPVKEDDNLYINAVPVNGFGKSNAFFVTQMPLHDTINDFWRLVNDNGSHAIVMLNSTFSDEERYWPIGDDLMETKSFLINQTGNGEGMSRDGLETTDLIFKFSGTYKKSSDSSSDDDSSCDDSVDRWSASQGLDPADPNQCSEGGGPDAWRPVRLLRVTDWPETLALPSDSSILLDLYDQVVQLRERHHNGCIVIQCMYGAARSGLFGALVNTLDRLNDQGTVGIFDAVKLIKERRQQFVSDFEQYNYLHQLVYTYLNKRKEKQTKAEISRDEQTMKQEKEPKEQEVRGSGVGSSVTAGVTRDRKRSADQRITEVGQEHGIGLNGFGTVDVKQDEVEPSKVEKVAKDVKELGDIAIIQQTKERGNNKDTKEPHIKGTNEAVKELKDQKIDPGTKEPQQNVIVVEAKEPLERESSQGITGPKDNGITDVPQDKARAMNDSLSAQEESNTKC